MPMFVDDSPAGECIFCKLVTGEIPSAKVYEDELTIAFMDIGQATRGHVLVASKRHAANLLELTPEETGAVMQTAQRVAAAVNQAFDPDGINIFQANGAPAGQTVFHFHLHVLPRYTCDGLAITWQRQEPGMPVLDELAARLRQALA
ncbi:putative cell-cycle regulation histidine triad (HIT) protein [Comamonas phosphati]|nr:putative cell-cycle regulation histidine triad (HIT) protein [Comamonas phosphati]